MKYSMKKIIFTLLGVMALVAVSCNDIDEADRYIYVKPAEKGRKVLVEDFTGQKCLNCPLANDVVHELSEQYGGDTIIAVAIHSGPLGFKKTGDAGALATDLGDTYYNAFKVDQQPMGMINRHGLYLHQAWKGLVYEEIQLKAPLDLEIMTNYHADGQRADITVNTLGINGTTTGKLQLWVVEDSITALQKMPDGTNNKQYVHNHVLRAAVNGDWGEDFTIAEGERKTNKFSLALDKAWKPGNVSIVAFVYNDKGVHQVSKAAVIQKK